MVMCSTDLWCFYSLGYSPRFWEFMIYLKYTKFAKFWVILNEQNKKLGNRRNTALQSALVLAKSGRIGLGDDILPTL